MPAISAQTPAEADRPALEQNCVEVQRIFLQPAIADIDALLQLCVKPLIVRLVAQVDKHPPPPYHRTEKVAERIVRRRLDYRLEVALGLIKAQIVNQVDAPLDARIEAAHGIGGLVRPGG